MKGICLCLIVLLGFGLVACSTAEEGTKKATPEEAIDLNPEPGDDSGSSGATADSDESASKKTPEKKPETIAKEKPIGKTPEDIFKAIMTAVVEDRFADIWDLTSSVTRKKFAESRDSVITILEKRSDKIEGDLSEMSDRELFGTLLQGGKEKTDKEKEKIINTKVIETEIDDDRAVLTIETPGKNRRTDKVKMIREDGLWRWDFAEAIELIATLSERIERTKQLREEHDRDTGQLPPIEVEDDDSKPSVGEEEVD